MEKKQTSKKESILDDLKSLVDKLGIEIEFASLSRFRPIVRSGQCTANGKRLIVLDKNLSVNEKIAYLAREIKNENLDEMNIKPSIREIIEKIL